MDDGDRRLWAWRARVQGVLGVGRTVCGGVGGHVGASRGLWFGAWGHCRVCAKLACCPVRSGLVPFAWWSAAVSPQRPGASAEGSAVRGFVQLCGPGVGFVVAGVPAVKLDGVVGGEVDREEQRGGMPIEDLDEAAVEVGIGEADVGVEGLGVGAPVGGDGPGCRLPGQGLAVALVGGVRDGDGDPAMATRARSRVSQSFYVGSGGKRARNSV